MNKTQISLIITLTFFFTQTVLGITNRTLNYGEIDTAKVNHYINKASNYSLENQEIFNKYIDSLNIITKGSTDAEYLARYYNLRAANFINIDELDSACIYINRGLKYLNKINNKITINNLLSNKGLSLLHTDSTKKALPYFKAALSNFQKDNDSLSIAKTFLDLSHVYKKLGNYDTSFYYIQLSLDHYEKIKDTLGLLLSGNAKAILYSELGFFKESVSAFYRIWGLDTIYDGYNLLPTIYLNLGDMYSRHFEMNDSAIFFLNNCLKEGKRLNNQFLIQASKVNLSNVYFNQNENQKIIDILVDNRKSKYGNVRISSIINTGVAMKNLNMDSASYILSEGIKQASELGFLIYQKIGLNHLYQFDSIRGDYKNAFIHYKQYIEIADSLNNQENTNLIARLKSQLDVEQEIHEKEYWKMQSLANSESLKRKSLVNKLMITVTITLLGFIVFLIFIRRRNIKYNNSLASINDELRKSNDELRKVNQMKNSLFSILSHDLKSHIAPSNQLLHIIDESYDTMDDNEKKDIIKSIVKTSDNVTGLMNNLLEWIRIQHTKSSHELKPLKLKNAIDKAITTQTDGLNPNNIEIKTHVDNDICIFSDENIIKTIFRNLISNSLKYTPKGGEINIEGKIKGSNYEIKFSDTGIGMKPEISEKIFDLSSKHTTPGMNNEHGSGFGLKLIHQMIEVINGKISVESELNKGTTFKIEFPICDKIY